MTADERLIPHFFAAWLLGAWVGLGWTDALAAAGQVQFVAGEVRLDRGGRLQDVVRGAEVEVGDILRSGSSGHAQIRFTDGGIMALYPQSQMAISAYRDGTWAGSGSDDRLAVRFVQGALRAVTGKIAQRNPKNYHVITPTAVVGVRGTAFKVFMNDHGEVEVSGEHNTIEVCTEAGCVEVKPREAVRVISAQHLPVYTHTRALLPLPLPREAAQPGEWVLPNGGYGAVMLVPGEAPTDPVPQQPNPVVPSDPGGGRPPGDPVVPEIPVTPTDPGGGRQPANPATPTNPTAPTPSPIVPIRPIRPIIPIGPIVVPLPPATPTRP